MQYQSVKLLRWFEHSGSVFLCLMEQMDLCIDLVSPISSSIKVEESNLLPSK